MLSTTTRRAVLHAALGMSVSDAVAPAPLITVSAHLIMTCGNLRTPCVVGRTGVRADKREGDGATPAGRYPLRRVLYRPDRLASVQSGLPVAAITRQDGWCDDPSNSLYNQAVRLPYAGHCEALWRTDSLYDVIAVIGYNDAPAVPKRGSAIFLHASRPAMRGTDGCIAVQLQILLDVLRRCGPETVINIEAP